MHLTNSKLNLDITITNSCCFYGNIRTGIENLYTLIAEQEKEHNIGIVSFSVMQEIYEDEIANDESDYLDKVDVGSLAKDFLPENSLEHPLIKKLNLVNALNTGYRQLSSGQSRKTLLAKEILTGKKKLLLYNPYDGLDKNSCLELNQVLEEIQTEVTLIILVNNKEDIPLWCSNLGIFKDDSLYKFGELAKILPHISENNMDAKEIDLAAENNKKEVEVLVKLVNGFANYGEKKLFANLNLEIKSGQHCIITGPNGCGKSTLLHIITGDNSKCYSNDLEVFGHKRGTGESIWEIKKQMGIVSPELHRNHRCPGSVLDIVLGGIYDSIGLYVKPTKLDIQQGKKWLDWLDMSDKKDLAFRRLSFAEQRLVLIARGLIKMPKLLILDEPTQGLDDHYREQLLELMNKIAKEELSTILFVSHREDEHRDLFCKKIALETYTSK